MYMDTLLHVCLCTFNLCLLVKMPFHKDSVPVHKAMSINKWFSQSGVFAIDLPTQSPDLSPPSDTSGMNCEPGLVTRHQWLTSVKLLWLNGSKSLQSGSQIMWKA